MKTLDWTQIESDINELGYATIKNILPPESCLDIQTCYVRDSMFRSHIKMARHGFGQGEYKYYSYPLPPEVERLRREFYPPLAQIANNWNLTNKDNTIYPDDHQTYLEACHSAGQGRPTPLILKYGEGDYNCLHQDLYGAQIFPLQVALLLSQPENDFTGGEFILTEQRPRMQSRVEVVGLDQGDAVIFPVRYRPKQGTRGTYKVNMRHGVSRVKSGARYTLGIIFHDAE